MRNKKQGVKDSTNFEACSLNTYVAAQVDYIILLIW